MIPQFSFRKAELQTLEGYLGILSTSFSTLGNTELLFVLGMKEVERVKLGLAFSEFTCCILQFSMMAMYQGTDQIVSVCYTD